MPITTSQKKTIEEIKKLPAVPQLLAIGQSPQAIEPPQTEDTSLLTYGPLATQYLKNYLGKNIADKTFGVYNKNDKFFIGDSPIDIRGDNIIVKDKEYIGTPGLWELIVKKNPSDIFTEDDMKNYGDIITETNAIWQNNNPNSGKPKSSRSNKWKNIIKPIYQARSQTVGSGHLNNLLERFDLLMASKNAGNTGLKEELIMIVNKLLSEGKINDKQHKYILTKI